MKLTRIEQAALYELTFSTGRADASTQRLRELGLVECGAGKFGTWVKITAKGRALANTFTREDQLSMLAASGGHTDPPSQSVRKKTQPAPSSGGPVAEATAKPPAGVSLPSDPPSRSASARRETRTQKTSPIKPSSPAPSTSSPRSPYLRKLHANRS